MCDWLTQYRDVTSNRINFLHPVKNFSSESELQQYTQLRSALREPFLLNRSYQKIDRLDCKTVRETLGARLNLLAELIAENRQFYSSVARNQASV